MYCRTFMEIQENVEYCDFSAKTFGEGVKVRNGEHRPTQHKKRYHNDSCGHDVCERKKMDLQGIEPWTTPKLIQCVLPLKN